MIPFEPAPARLPDGHRVYAVGDVHGCLDKLKAMHAAIAADFAARPVPSPLLVHLGDLVDRGPDSAGVIALLSAGSPIPGIGTVNLMGNHEHMALTALAGQDRGAIALWMDNGGAAALDSWRVPPGAPAAEWPSHIPSRHLIFLRDLVPMHRLGPYLFVHAGVRPGVPIERQSREDLMWIREPFLSFDGDYGAVVVHGHTPRREAEVRHNRISVDTGAVMGGDLTCAVLESAWIGFLRV
ncbi:MAG: serine/threonine protein phosphatase [Proteobacteria bacterium]|nr:serine/threonine protein phosphatase [Pseudomonadota bacterium]